MVRGSTRLRTARVAQAIAPHAVAPDALARIEAYARIASAIFIPFAIAFTGWWVQSSVAEATIKKDYVTMAMDVLKEGKADPEIITWAAEVVRQNSPTPLSNALQAKIVRAALTSSQAKLQYETPAPPDVLMVPPRGLSNLTESRLIHLARETPKAVLQQWLDDRKIANENAIKLKYLQEWMVEIRNSEKNLREKLLDISTEQVIKEDRISKEAAKK